MTIDRRKFMGYTGASLALTPFVGVRPAYADDIKMGSVLDTSGVFDAYGKPMDRATRLAVDEINAAGGLNGSQIDLISYDTQSDMALYTQYAQRLVREDEVDVVHGGILSASREAVRQTFRRSKTLYFYNVLYEGGVCDRNIFITGITPAQQVATLVPHIVERWGKKLYILAADYNYGQYQAQWVQRYAENAGAEVLQTDFFPLDVSDFSSTIAKVQAAAPDILVSVLVGGAHLSFYRQWAGAGMNTRIPMASTTLGVGNEHKVLTPEEGNGIVVALNYSQELDTPANNAFKRAWSDKYGDSNDIHEIAVSTYQGVHLWAKAVREAGSVDRDALIETLETGLSIEGPAGTITVDPATHHVTLDAHILEIENQQMQVLDTVRQVPPSDTQNVCDLQANPDDNQQYELDI